MRRQGGNHVEDQIWRKTTPAAVGGPFAATNGSLSGAGSLSDHPPAAGPEYKPRGAHVMTGESPTDEPRGAHVMRGESPTDEPRGAHVMRGESPTDEPRGAHVMRGESLTDEPRGAHVMRGDALLSVERRALHASPAELPVTPVFSTTPREAAALVSTAPNLILAVQVPTKQVDRAIKRGIHPTKRQGAHATASRRWGLVPVAGAAGALVVGLGGGGAFAYLDAVLGHGSGSGQTTAGGPVTAPITATTGTADLLPGRAGAAYFTLHNIDSSGRTFDQVAPGATVVSDNTRLCASSYVSLAQTLPYTLSPAITVSPGGTSGTQFIPALVKLAPNAPNTCQGVTFTVTFTLSGRSS